MASMPATLKLFLLIWGLNLNLIFSDDRPNFIVWQADDLPFNFDDAPEIPESAGGANIAPTPHHNKMRAESLVFTRGYTAGPKCSPSRYSLLTMKYCSRSHYAQQYTQKLFTKQQAVPLTDPPGEGWAGQNVTAHYDFRTANTVAYCKTQDSERNETVAHDLQKAGYETIHVGKWHIHAKADLGYDDYWGAVAKLQEFGFSTVDGLYPDNLETEFPFSHNPEWMLEAALNAIQAAVAAGKPFYLSLAPTMPNGGDIYCEYVLTRNASQTPAGVLDHLPDPGMPSRESQYARALNSSLANACSGYQVGVVMLDDMLGVLLDKLDEWGLAASTWFLVTSDHGMVAKGHLYEGGARVPTWIRYPAGYAAGESDVLVNTVDMGATILELAGAPASYEHDGTSFHALAASGASDDRQIYTEIANDRSLIGRRWKYISRSWLDTHDKADTGYYPYYYEAEQLYDLDSDPTEQVNVAYYKTNRATLLEMRDQICEIEVGAGLYNIEGERVYWCPVKMYDKNMTYMIDDTLTNAPTPAPTLAPTAHCEDGHSVKIGYAFDGYPIYGPFTCGGELPDDLDRCNGHAHGGVPGYHYHTTGEAPYTVGCFRGEVLCATVNNKPSDCLSSTGDLTGASSASDLSCAALEAEFYAGVEHQVVPFAVDADKIPTPMHCGEDVCPGKAAYRWLTDEAYASGMTNAISCTEYDDYLEISSNGLPGHSVGDFPLDSPSDGTVGQGGKDCSYSLAEQAYTWQIPRRPTPQAPGRHNTALNDTTALPKNGYGAGFMLNGVPFWALWDKYYKDALNGTYAGFEVRDLCYGRPYKNGEYYYRETPWCLLGALEARAGTGGHVKGKGNEAYLPAHRLGDLLYTEAPTPAPTPAGPTAAPTPAPTAAPTVDCSAGHGETDFDGPFEPSWWRYQPLRQPEVIAPEGEGEDLEFELSVEPWRYVGVVNFTTRAYCYKGKCDIPGPTFTFTPGTNVTCHVTNRLGKQAHDHGWYAHNTLHSPNTTNVHTHGLHISAKSDNIFVEIEPGETHTYKWEIPSHHYAGFHWYHSHIHGASHLQVIGGMVGGIITPFNEFVYDVSAEWEKLQQVQLVLTFHKFGTEFGDACDQNEWIEEGGVKNQFKVLSMDEYEAKTNGNLSINWESMLPSTNPYHQYTAVYDGEFYGAGYDNREAHASGTYNITQFWLVNGQYQPVLNLTAGVGVVLRQVNAGGSWTLAMGVPGCTTKLIARDGVYFENGHELELDHWAVPAAGRADVFLKCSCPGVYYLRAPDEDEDTRIQIDTYTPPDKLLILNVTADPGAEPMAEMPPIPGRPYYLETLLDLDASEIDQRHWVHFEQEGPYTKQCQWVMNEEPFHGEDVYASEGYLGDVSEWTLTGKGSMTHPYHQHVNHFQVVRCDREDPSKGGVYAEGEWRDTFPAMQGNCTIRFLNDLFADDIVYHCHFLHHEDRGMMHVYKVWPSAMKPTPAPTIAPVYTWDDLTPDEQAEVNIVASKLFAYAVVGEALAEWLPAGKPSQYFGFPYFRYMETQVTVSRGNIGYMFLSLLSDDVRTYMANAVDSYMAELWPSLNQTRAEMIADIWRGKADPAYELKDIDDHYYNYGYQQYYWDAKVALAQADACLYAFGTLAEADFEAMAEVRAGGDFDISALDTKSLESGASDATQMKNTAGKCFVWATGSLNASQYLSEGRVSNYFGFAYLREYSDHADSLRSVLATAVREVLSEGQLNELYKYAVKVQGLLAEYKATRNQAVEMFWNYKNASYGFDEARFLELAQEYGGQDGQLGYYQGKVFQEIYHSMTKQQLTYLQLVINGTEGVDAAKFAPSDAPTPAPTQAPTSFCAPGHSAQVGYALDGYPIYGPYTCGGALPRNLDECNGHSHGGGIDGYHYHTTPEAPYVLGCYHGEVLCSTVGNTPKDCVASPAELVSSPSESDLTCAKLLAASAPHNGVPFDLVPWSVDAGRVPSTAHCGEEYCDPRSPYAYDLPAAAASGLSSSLECHEGNHENVLRVTSRGLPSHPVGSLPLDYSGGTLGTGAKDTSGSFGVEAQNYTWVIPKRPTAYSGTRSSVMIDSQELSKYGSPVGFALNGVPFYTMYNKDVKDALNTTDPNNFEVLEYCYGQTNKGAYYYRLTPWCLLNDTHANDSAWYAAHRIAHKMHTDAPTRAPTVAPTP